MNQALTALSTTLMKLQRGIVNEHSKLRKADSPTASNLPKMGWRRRSAENDQWMASPSTNKHSDSEYQRTSYHCRYQDIYLQCGYWKKIGSWKNYL
ncbi:hypothetical protein GHT09_000844 [Marmota monax]|uniref:Uncharacterized protein n=1 Tax=Marmota monax TaxID=9995 RepID=A0A834QW82_MARMO|nr:hypothetical protein GHT09_000844 [Marmota monax]